MKHKKLIAVLIAVLVALIACWIYVNDYYHADESAVETMAGITNP